MQPFLHNVVQRWRASVEALPAGLRAELLHVEAEWSARVPEANPIELFVSPTGTPALLLVQWVGEALGCSEARRVLAGEAMLAAYFAVRVQDDLVDANVPRSRAYLQTTLFALAARRLAELGGDSVLHHWNQLLVRFSEAALQDAGWRSSPSTPWTPTHIQAQGDKYLPMAGPLIAMAGVAHAEAIESIVCTLSVGLQLTNDLLGMNTDLQEGVHTPWLGALGFRVGQHTPADRLARFRAAERSGHIEAYLQHIEASFERGREALVAFGCPPGQVDRHLQARAAKVAAHITGTSLHAAFQEPPLTIDIELTRRCNLRCPDCFVFAQEPNLRQLAQLDTALLHEVLDELAGYRPHFHLTGGEPFSHPAVWHILDRAVAQGVAEVVINTNGTFLTDARLARLAALDAPVRLLMSIDGPPGTHARTRGAANERTVFDALRRACQHGLDALPTTILSAELVAYGVGRWQDWLAEQLGEPLHLVLWPLFSDAESGVGHMLSPDHVRRCARDVAERMLGDGPDITVADYPVINPWLRAYGVPAARLWQCEAGRGRMCIQADATLTPCHPFRLPVGQLEPGRVAGFVQRVRHNPTYQRIGARTHSGCTTCPEQAICGSCQARVVGSGAPLFTNDGQVAGCTLRTPLPVAVSSHPTIAHS